MVNTLKLKGRMAELGIKQKDLAKHLNLSASTVSQKIRGERPITLDEAEALSMVLHIEAMQFREFFYQ